jgi:3-hydroxybutyryl-CoA dehydrogenase
LSSEDFQTAVMPPIQPIRIAVIGAGAAGRSFAAACAAAGFEVALEDVMPEKLRRAQAELGPLGDRVRLASTVEDAVEDADLAIDFVPDELESKLEIWALLDRMAPPRTILCTPSEALSITDLASCTYRANLCVMVRGALDPNGGVRVLHAGDTAHDAVTTVRKFFQALGFVVTVERDPDLPQLLKNMNAASLR